MDEEICGRLMAVPASLCQFGGPTEMTCELPKGHEERCAVLSIKQYDAWEAKNNPWVAKNT